MSKLQKQSYNFLSDSKMRPKENEKKIRRGKIITG